jgi:hypothetical protein
VLDRRASNRGSTAANLIKMTQNDQRLKGTGSWELGAGFHQGKIFNASSEGEKKGRMRLLSFEGCHDAAQRKMRLKSWSLAMRWPLYAAACGWSQNATIRLGIPKRNTPTC